MYVNTYSNFTKIFEHRDGVMEQGRISVLQWNKHPTLLIQKCNKKVT